MLPDALMLRNGVRCLSASRTTIRPGALRQVPHTHRSPRAFAGSAACLQNTPRDRLDGYVSFTIPPTLIVRPDELRGCDTPEMEEPIRSEVPNVAQVHEMAGRSRLSPQPAAVLGVN